MVQLTRGGPKLLKVVNKKRHASDEDHDEPAAKRERSPVTQKTREEEDINAEPLSTDDELQKPSPRTQKRKNIYAAPASSDEQLRAPTPRSSRPSKASSIAAKMATSQEADELKVPTKKPSTNGQKDSANKNGAKEIANDDKENSSSAVPQSSASSAIFGGLEHASQGSGKRSRPKTTFSSKAKVVVNIHAEKPKERVPKAQAPMKAERKAPRVPDAHKKKAKKATTEDEKSSVDSDSDVSMVGLESDPELRSVGFRNLHKKNIGFSNSTFDNAELHKVLEGTPEDEDLPRMTKRARTKNEKSALEDKDLTRATKRSRPTVLHDQLGDWIKDRGPGSSQPASSAPSQDINNLKEYLEQLPEEEVEGTFCPLCRAPVNDEDYWDYWKGKEKTVKNQNKFCHAHRMKSAWDEYRSEGYPDIMWADLPQRIRKHRMTLFKILNNERSSGYRARYEPIALTGNAAAVPTKRKDLPEHVQQELESYALDHQSVYPGYYGPHGRRVITESIMKLLKNEIKNCTDAVVQGSGPATFVQAVLVPEMAVLLIMEDCRVDREEAEDIREKTYELGMLLNEEIEDQVELHDHSDDENEYGVR